MKLENVILCYNLQNFLSKLLGSGYSGRMEIKEIEPFSKKFIKNFLRSCTPLKEESEIEKYIEMFDGNMKMIKYFIKSGKNLSGILIFFIYVNLEF